jgi:purine nucleosidase
MKAVRILILALCCAAAAAARVPVIFDTDMGNDIDDALALAMLYALDARGECELLAVTLTNPAPATAPFIRLLNAFYGRTDIPVGVSVARRKEGADHKYTDAALAAMPRPTAPATEMPAPRLLRKVLAAARSKVTIVQVGFSDNLGALLNSGPDEYSPLDGRALAAAKVSVLSIMAGDFATPKPEYNVRIDVAAARKVIEGWPTPVVLSGFEIGSALLFPAASIERDFAYAQRHPVVIAYRAYERMPYDRPTWDLTSVLYAVRPDSGYFTLSAPGTVRVEDNGRTVFSPSASGTRRHLILPPGAEDRVLEAMRLLASQPPTRAAAR